jgi:type II secretion system protein H
MYIFRDIATRFLKPAAYDKCLKRRLAMLNKKGFTIIELLVVLAIVGIIITLAVSSMANTIPHLRLNDSVGELVSRINLARSTAIARNKAYVVSFNKLENTYNIFMDDNENWQREDDEDTITDRQMTKGVSIVKVSFSFGTTAFGYDGSGLPFKNRIGSVCLKNDKDEYHKISVSWNGRAKVYKNVKKKECE